MGQELLDVGTYERPKRVFYLATTSTGYKFVRGSWIDKYTHAVVCSKAPNFRPDQIETYGSCHARKDLAQRNFNRLQKFNRGEFGYEYELIELVKISAKEVRAIKKQSKNEYEQWREEQRNATEGKETENN
jgi:hypothetical protein